MADTSNKARKKAIYVDNVTTIDYMSTYLRKHKDSENFSYIVFTYNINGTVHPYNKHGDIFYNGYKLTYINDVCHTDIVKDDFSNYLCYINSYGAFDYAQSYLYVESNNNVIKDSYSLYSEKNPRLDVVHWTNFRDFVDFRIDDNDGWIYDNDNELVFDKDDDILHIKGENLTASRHFKISYNYHINNTQYSDKYDININLYDKVTEVSFFDFPQSFDVGQIYTPKIKVTPTNQYSYYTFKYHTQDTDFIDINENTGRFVCKRPAETAAINCSYYKPNGTFVNTFEQIFTINKLKNHLKMTSTYTSYIWGSTDDEKYTYTVCYVHNYPCQHDDDSWFSVNFIGLDHNDNYYWETPNRAGENSKNMSYMVSYNKSGVYKIGAHLDPSIYNCYTSYMEINANVELVPIDIIYFKPQGKTDDTLTGVIVTATNLQGNYFTSTNFQFNASDKYDNFMITDIVHDNNYTYTYITAEVVSDTSYGVIQISSLDESFMTYTFEI